MPFKPLTKTALVKKPADSASEADAAEVAVPQTPTEIIETTTERIRVIFDDSSSMHERVRADDGTYKHAYELAAEGTVDYMKSCTPKKTAVGIDFLNQAELPLTRNLPKLAPEVTERAGNGGGTPLFAHLQKLVVDQPTYKHTRALIFTDGEAGDGWHIDIPKLMGELLELGIPIDLILIGDFDVASLSSQMTSVKTVVEQSKGTFMICKDGAIFKAKLKFFAPPLRYMLTAIASKEN